MAKISAGSLGILQEIKGFFTKKETLDVLPRWMKSSAAQQGVMFWFVSLISLIFVASITLWYVESELDQQNEKIYVETKKIAQTSRDTSNTLFQAFDYEIDDDPIDDDEIIDIMSVGFLLSAIFQSILSAFVVSMLVRFSDARVRRIEQVLDAAAEGDLSARTQVNHTYYDLARVAVSVDEMLSRLQGSVSAMTDISSNIAHELKTPITRLRHNLLTIKEEAEKAEGKNTKAFYAQLDDVLEEVMRIASIFDALLRISQIESGSRRSRFTQVDLNDVIELISDIYTDVADESGMSLRIKMAHYLVQIQGDRELIIQQIANLIENALRYCTKGCVIKVETGINVLVQQAWIRVEDNGPGIDETEKERVFERLYRVDKSRTDGGLGLGLSLAKAVAILHAGVITLYDCKPGLGVKVAFPLAVVDEGSSIFTPSSFDDNE